MQTWGKRQNTVSPFCTYITKEKILKKLQNIHILKFRGFFDILPKGNMSKNPIFILNPKQEVLGGRQ
jgi:hypothetical protein